MVNLKKIGATFGMLVSLVFLIHGCGGGGGGGGGGNNNQNAAPAAQAAGSASKAVSTALNLATAGMNGTTPPLTLKPGGSASVSDAAQVNKALKAFKSAVTNRNKLQTITPGTPIPCSVSGDILPSTDDNDTPENSLDDKTITTYRECVDSEGTVTNGSLTMTLGGNPFSFDYDNYVIRTTFSGAVSETVIDGGLSFGSVDGPCGMLSGTMTDNFTVTNKFDQTGDGTFEVNSSFATNMTMTLAQVFAEEDCTLESTTLTFNGGTTSTSSVNSQNDVVTFTDFTMVLTPETRVIDGVETDGDTLSLNGTIEISSSCTDDTTFTISTPAGEEPFVPEDGSCPVDGRFIITNGNNTVAVIYTSTGGVQIDEGNDGSIDDTFAGCNDAEGICSGTEV
jgi:hypothetical protein